jgi:hypothetical protein
VAELRETSTLNLRYRIVLEILFNFAVVEYDS